MENPLKTPLVSCAQDVQHLPRPTCNSSLTQSLWTMKGYVRIFVCEVGLVEGASKPLTKSDEKLMAVSERGIMPLWKISLVWCKLAPPQSWAHPFCNRISQICLQSSGNASPDNQLNSAVTSIRFNLSLTKT